MSSFNTHSTIPRRSMLQCAASIGGVSLMANALSQSSSAANPGSAYHALDDVILFQGDSITDAGRNKKSEGANNFEALGAGYANMIATALLGAHASLRLQCYNRGISGHKVPDLQKRWQSDTIDLKPAVLSILIGVNDMWHKMDNRYDGTVADYEEGFTRLLADTRAALPETHIVICEPFVLRCGAINETWFPEFDERRAAAKRVAEAAQAAWVPYQSMFDAAVSDVTPPSYWAGDGVHPTIAGHALMARTWLDVTGL